MALQLISRDLEIPDDIHAELFKVIKFDRKLSFKLAARLIKTKKSDFLIQQLYDNSDLDLEKQAFIQLIDLA